MNISYYTTGEIDEIFKFQHQNHKSTGEKKIEHFYNLRVGKVFPQMEKTPKVTKENMDKFNCLKIKGIHGKSHHISKDE